MEIFLNLFENVIKDQAVHIGPEEAFARARKAGLGVSDDGHIVSCTGNPQLVLLRLIRCFCDGGNVLTLATCRPLLDELLKNQSQDEVAETPTT